MEEYENYRKLLENIYRNLPEEKVSGERFEVPVAEVIIVGNRTIIKNFKEICDKLNRDPKHLSKYLTKNLATSGNFEGERYILNSKINEKMINDRIKKYCEDFVICKQCKRPDTKLKELERGTYYLICEACGARSSVPKI
ncbi:MAG: translation initiation factor IF-2 subunit beta, partial [Candidatus Aenigmatarchaeota archaeon]